MKIQIITPEKELYQGDILSVKLPGTDGEFEILNNHAAIISTLTKGEIKVILFNHGKKIFKVENGLRIAQMVLCPVIEAKLFEAEIIEETERGEGGFGSTGVK